MIHKCQNKHIERKNSGVLKFFDLSASNLSDAARECHGFVNPCGLVPRVPAGAGTG